MAEKHVKKLLGEYVGIMGPKALDEDSPLKSLQDQIARYDRMSKPQRKAFLVYVKKVLDDRCGNRSADTE